MACRKCPLSARELQETSSCTIETSRLYVAPQLEDWPIYDPQQKVFVLQGGPPHGISMINMTHEDRESLAPLKLFCTFEALRGQSGTAPVANIKKLSVIRAEWAEQPVRSSIRTDVAKAAFDFLMANNEAYATYVKEHSMRRTSRTAARSRPMAS